MSGNRLCCTGSQMSRGEEVGLTTNTWGSLLLLYLAIRALIILSVSEQDQVQVGRTDLIKSEDEGHGLRRQLYIRDVLDLGLNSKDLFRNQIQAWRQNG